MKILRGGGWITNLQIIFGAELKKALESRARMLRPLTFVAMRQQQGEPRSLSPLVFRSRDVLIDDRLRAVYEVAKLRLPKHQRLARHDRVAILKTKHAFLGKRAVKNFKTRFRTRVRSQFGERCPRLAGLRVVQNSVSLAESSAPGILSTQAHARTFNNQRTNRHSFREGPVNRQLSGAHFCAPRQLAHHLG